LLDDVMNRLVSEVEASARVQLSEYLAECPLQAPKTMRKLAMDDLIEVARPILASSEHVDAQALEEWATTGSQAHLMAISSRARVPEPVTEILMDRGNREVVLCVAANAGARFSAFGFASLVLRSYGDEDLTVATWIRSDVPRRHLLKLFADASSAVKARLCKEDPTKGKAIEDAIVHAVDRLQSQTRRFSPECSNASTVVRLLEQSGKLDEVALRGFANSKRFSEAAMSLASMCELPAGLIERALIDDRAEQILVLARAAGLSWETARALLVLKSRPHEARDDLERLLEVFLRLRPQTARKAVQFYRLRERALGQGGSPGGDGPNR